MEPHRERTDGSNTSPASPLLSSYGQVFLGFFRQVQIPCYILSSCATSFVEPYRRSVPVVPVKHCCLEEDLSRPTISFRWAVLCVVDFLSLILVGQSTGETDETMKRKMKRRKVHHTSTSNDFHAALFVDKFPRPSIEVWTIENSPILHTNLAQPHYLFNRGLFQRFSGNVVRGIAGEKRRRCVCFSIDLSFLFRFWKANHRSLLCSGLAFPMDAGRVLHYPIIAFHCQVSSGSTC